MSDEAVLVNEGLRMTGFTYLDCETRARMRLKYLIVDDEEIDRLTVETRAAEFPFLHKIAACSHPIEALELIDQCSPDIIFADIEMPVLNGMELIRQAGNKVAAPVFITSHSEFAVDSYELDAFDYLLKPVTPERFEKCALRLRDFFGMRSNAFAFAKEQETDSLTIKQAHDKYKITFRSILYLEALRDYVCVVTDTKKYMVLATIGSLQQKLPPERFARIHRSYIVNTSYVNARKLNRVEVNGHELPVGKMYKHVLNDLL